jgi:GMP synthase (glutamine-hydrolysing)
MRNALVIRHVAFEDLGTLAPALGRHGYRIRYLEPGALGGAAGLQAALLVILGGPIGACDDARYPWLAEEAALLKRRIDGGRPTLGICLGAQLIARALGAKVYAAESPEIGYAPIELTPAGRASALRHLGSPATPVLHWHGDTFDLPERAVLLASTAVCANQAFSIDDRVLGLQFHPEFEAASLERWLIGHTVELGLAGVAPGSLRDQARRLGPALERQAARLWTEWLEGLDR